MTKSNKTENYNENNHSENTFIDGILPLVEKPGRYTGGEVNAVIKDFESVKLRFALVFPDVYEVGMSHLGLKILYSILNSRKDILAERCFAVWPDMEEKLREKNARLRSLENGLDLKSFDVIGFSLQYELAATSVLQILDLAQIPLLSSQRGHKDPIILSGGPVTANPAVFGQFFDAMAIGDSEEMVLEIADSIIASKERSEDRDGILSVLASIKGLYVPSFAEAGHKVERRIINDLNSSPFPTDPIVPLCETIHDRIGIEVARGCTRGCRFCQAGILYRPVRERNPETIKSLAEKSLLSTGLDEIALLSLSTGDYTHIGSLIRDLTHRWSSDMVALSLPSMRTETFDRDIAEQIKKVRKTGFTLAPEAGSERLRQVINKGNTREDLIQAVKGAFEAGWQRIKLYFMIGLPTETWEDLDAIVDTVKSLSRLCGRGKITVSVSTFIPKAHTPFQWERQISVEETREKQEYISRGLRKIRIKPKFHNAETSLLEGVIARGDSKISNVILEAYKKGARLDGWEDQLQPDIWFSAFQELKIDPGDYLKERPLDVELPWDIVDIGISKEFLIMERQRAYEKAHTPDCRSGECQGCGVCDFESIEPVIGTSIAENGVHDHQIQEKGDIQVRRYRLKYSKTGRSKYLSHRDLIRAFHRAFRRAGFALDYTKGFHPHPKMRFSLPIPLGVESHNEYLDFDLIEGSEAEVMVSDRLAKSLPEGLNILDLQEITLNDQLISDKIKAVIYQLNMRDRMTPQDLEQRILEYNSLKSLNITKRRKGKDKTRDLKEFINWIDQKGPSITISLKVDRSGSVNPLDAFSALIPLNLQEVKTLEIIKVGAEFT